jgi:ABC-2 type transport system permease protein
VLHQIRAELLMLVRAPAFGITNLAVPIIVFVLIGLPSAEREVAGINGAVYSLASIASYAVLNVMLFTFSTLMINDRAQRIDLLMRLAPIPPLAYLVARAVAAVTFAAAILCGLYLFAILTAGVRLDLDVWTAMTWRLLLGSLPFIAFSFVIVYSVGPEAASSLLNLFYIPLMFASGLLLPLEQLPRFLQEAAPYLPTYRYAQLAWGAVDAQTDPLVVNVLWLLGYGLVCLTVAVFVYERAERRLFG